MGWPAWEVIYKLNLSQSNSSIVYGGFTLQDNLLGAEYNSGCQRRIRSRGFTLGPSSLLGAAYNSKMHSLLDAVSLAL